ncbi:MAG: ECF-type sigma factor [Verrucomicrobiota bacterium]
MEDVSKILEQMESDTRLTTSRLIPTLYDELRSLAARKMSDEAAGQTLTATALVHEAYMRLIGEHTTMGWRSRGHFYGAAAEAMRRILIENARRKKTLKRGGGEKPVEFLEDDHPIEELDERLLDLDAALEKLARIKPEVAELVKLRFYAGLDYPEIASILDMSERTASRKFAYARAWLKDELEKT